MRSEDLVFFFNGINEKGVYALSICLAFQK